jgi:hypothetical protein
VGGRSSTGNRGRAVRDDERSSVAEISEFDLIRKGIANTFFGRVSAELHKFAFFGCVRRVGTRPTRPNVPVRHGSYASRYGVSRNRRRTHITPTRHLLDAMSSITEAGSGRPRGSVTPSINSIVSIF